MILDDFFLILVFCRLISLLINIYLFKFLEIVKSNFILDFIKVSCEGMDFLELKV